ncbi:MAG: cytochrome c maturation protein CcmE [Rhodothalassiaceae bacterium]
MSRLRGARAHKAKQRRLIYGVVAIAGLALAGTFLVLALGERALYFRTPAQLIAEPIEPGRPFRLGGMVADGSVQALADAVTVFAVEAGGAQQPVRYRGVLPDLFREGQGVVAEGALDETGLFVARRVLAKHDENYMPPELAESMRQAAGSPDSAEAGS